MSEPSFPMSAESTSTISESQREAFCSRGVLKVPGLLPAEGLRPVRQMVARSLESAGVCAEGLWTAPRLNGLADHELQSKLTKGLKASLKHSQAVSEAFGNIIEAAARALLDAREVSCPVDRPQLLFTPPNAEHWRLPHKVWHVDAPRLGELGCPGAQAFLFLEPVLSGGGGTVVAAGSHRYLNGDGKVRSKDIKKRIRGQHPFFRELLSGDPSIDRSQLMALAHDGDIPLQVVELTGEPGDVWFTDMRVLHSLAPNSADRPRLMMTQRYYLPGLTDLL